MIIGFALETADPGINWPAPGSAEKTLSARPGWAPANIPVVSAGKRKRMDAMCSGELAVNVMLDGDGGFAICLASSGFRISYGGRVFARCCDAMKAAEEMMAACSDWSSCEKAPYSREQISVMKRVMEEAEKRGEIMLERVFPR